MKQICLYSSFHYLNNTRTLRCARQLQRIISTRCTAAVNCKKFWGTCLGVFSLFMQLLDVIRLLLHLEKGKKLALQKLKSNIAFRERMKVFNSSISSLEEVSIAGENFLIAMYQTYLKTVLKQPLLSHKHLQQPNNTHIVCFTKCSSGEALILNLLNKLGMLKMVALGLFLHLRKQLPNTFYI
ncbi:hypothetical protein PR048_004538 [Dryococelus australis]|uniref:Uncharacterized protein n=1 Tax=Dryococelus australis TaxID=614101 RepID=A0ABQ9I5Q2_9NEOP|nr:hypothetical protein PR048_004538 [Dryococelus australis]